MKISVAMCTYNGARYIADQLASILSQSKLPDEIVICDDCSTDTTTAEINKIKYSSTAISITLIPNDTQLGVVKNFEKVLSLCSGDIIFLCDQDDLWHENKVETCINYFESHPYSDVFFSNARLLGANGTLWEKVRFSKKAQSDWEKYGALYAFLRYKSICTGAAMALRRGSLSYLLPFKENPFQIHDGWIGIAAAVKQKIDYTNECLFTYRIHDHQWTYNNTSSIDISKKEDILLKCQYMRFFIDYYNMNDTIITSLYDHYKKRENLPNNYLKRAGVVLKEVLNGNYFVHSNGLKSIIRDLFLT